MWDAGVMRARPAASAPAPSERRVPSGAHLGGGAFFAPGASFWGGCNGCNARIAKGYASAAGANGHTTRLWRQASAAVSPAGARLVALGLHDALPDASAFHCGGASERAGGACGAQRAQRESPWAPRAGTHACRSHRQRTRRLRHTHTTRQRAAPGRAASSTARGRKGERTHCRWPS
jgi:hypothetical protein